MAAYPGWAPIANGVQLQKARMLVRGTVQPASTLSDQVLGHSGSAVS